MTGPLRLSFDVACPVEHAFTVWTTGIAAWWPRDHTVTGQPGLTVVLQGRVGGRIYERTADGTEHDWGEVTAWEPPARLAYRWHLGRGPDEYTEVNILFRAAGAVATQIEIEHVGWERLGNAAGVWRDRNRAGWESLLPYFFTEITEETAHGRWQQGRSVGADDPAGHLAVHDVPGRPG